MNPPVYFGVKIMFQNKFFIFSSCKIIPYSLIALKEIIIILGCKDVVLLIKKLIASILIAEAISLFFLMYGEGDYRRVILIRLQLGSQQQVYTPESKIL